MLVDFSCEIEILGDTGFLAVNLNMCDCLLHGAVVTEIDFQRFLLGSLGGVCPVTFRRFLDAVHIRVLTTAYPYLLEIIAVVMVVQGIDGEYLLTLNRGKTENGGNILISVLELRLVEKYLHVRIVDDSLLHNRGSQSRR